ncbi:winged helix-turn-helix transcriptional regulator [Intestinibacter sp.]|uniref:winged helix-turn-helix transcriptional regulator n=1 Tax=Intestinibacter sp. TaxID=1965304 RepID=UPI003F18E8F6
MKLENIDDKLKEKYINCKSDCKGSLDGRDCPVKFTLDVLNGKWKMKLIWELIKEEPLRYNELQRRLDGISNVVLSKTLKELMKLNIVNRVQFNEIPPHVEYSLTPIGKELIDVFEVLYDWGKKAKMSQVLK